MIPPPIQIPHNDKVNTRPRYDTIIYVPKQDIEHHYEKKSSIKTCIRYLCYCFCCK